MKMPRALPVALAAFLVAASATAPARAAIFADDDARRAIVELRQQNKALQEQAARLEARLDALGRANLENVQQNQLLREEVARLRGLFEERVVQLSADLASAQRQQREAVAAATAAADERLKRIEPIEVIIDGRSVRVDQVEKRTFESALERFRASDWRGALNAFRDFDRLYPASPYAPQSAYFAGSAQWALKDQKAALATLQSMASKFPDSPRTPDAMLLTSTIHAELGDRKAARRALTDLIDRYPGAPAATAARERLPSLK